MDKLQNARNIVLAVFLFFVLSVTFILIAPHAGFHRRQSPFFVRALSLTSLATAPTGQSLRNVELMNPAVDLRFSPLLLRPTPDCADILSNSESSAIGKGDQ